MYIYVWPVRVHPDLHGGMEYLESVVLQCDRELGVVWEDEGHSGVEEREEGGHGR